MVYICKMEQKEFEESLKIIQNYKTDESSGIAYVDVGKGGQTLLFVHGLGSNRFAWVNNVVELSKHHRCILIDLPNYGDSEKGDFSFSLTFFKDRIYKFCYSLGLRNVTMVGHSMGAQIAVKAGVEKPSFIGKLILLTPAGIETFNEFEKQWLRQINIPEILFNAPEEQIRKNFEINFERFGIEAEWLLLERLEFMKDKKAYFKYCKMICKCVDAMLNEPSSNVLHQLIQPTLVVFAEEDKLIPNRMLHSALKYNDLMAVAERKIINAEVATIKNAGHFAQIDNYREVNRIILNFLD